MDDPVSGVDQETRFGSEFLRPELWLRECKKVQVDLLRFHSEFPPPKVLHDWAACIVFNGVLGSWSVGAAKSTSAFSSISALIPTRRIAAVP